MAEKRDFYEIMGVSRNASDEDIRTSFRKLAFQFHPDKNKDAGATEKFKQINEAYEVLSDPQKRGMYDRYGHAGINANGAQANGYEGFGGLGDIFDAFFGSATASRNAPRQGSDLEQDLTITFEEAAFGVKKEISITRSELCRECRGSGSKAGTKPDRCPTCNGTGQIRRVHQSLFGQFVNSSVCGQCRGQGSIITEPCMACRGAGKTTQERKLEVKIPAGVNDGSQLCLSGEGEAGFRGGSPGDFYLNIAVIEHPLFNRDGDDVIYEMALNSAQAALGIQTEVPTLKGNAKLDIPAGSQSGTVFRLKGKGIPHLNGGGIGDEIIVLSVVTPSHLSKRQQDLFKELAESLGPDNLPPNKKHTHYRHSGR